MDNKDQRRKLIEEKIKVVHQKENRKNFIDLLPSDLRGEFVECSYITYPEDRVIINDAFDIIKAVQKNEIADSLSSRNFKYCYKEVSRKKQVEAIIKSFAFGDETQRGYFGTMERESPIFIIDFNYVRSVMQRIWEATDYGSLLLVTEDCGQGIMIDHYCGYLLQDPNPKEIVYEVVAWGYCRLDQSFL